MLVRSARRCRQPRSAPARRIPERRRRVHRGRWFHRTREFGRPPPIRRRGGGHFGFNRGDAFVRAERGVRELLEFLQARQLVEIGEAEAHQELLRRAVEDGPADHVLAAGRGDQALFEQRLDHAADVHAANFVNFRHRDGLLVGDHGEGFERRHRQAQRRLQALDEVAHHVVMLRLGVELLAAGDVADFDAAIVGLIGGDQ